MPLFCDFEDLVTESDVEQKLIYPILSSAKPLGLGLDNSQILTKSVLRQREIGKGQTKKYYYPDYLVSIRGIPIMVVEAKKPGESLPDAFSEARLYAAEVNAGFPHKVNACYYIMVCNGSEIWAGYSDTADPVVKVLFSEINVESQSYVTLIEFCAKEKLEVLANQPYAESRGKAIFNTPVSLLGGKRVQNSELEENSFGRTFIFENRTIFDPETESDRKVVVENAYITSAKREQHIEPMYKEIRKFEIPSIGNTTPLATEAPTELVQRLSMRVEQKNEAYSLFLIIGNVGSGKTTFVRYFQNVFLEKNHPDLSRQCDWVFVNMNTAPVSTDEIYPWIKQQIIDNLKTNHSDIDFSSIEIIRKVFRKTIKEFDSGIGALLVEDKAEYNKELFNLLQKNQDDTTLYLHSLISFLKGNGGFLPIVVLDNCDKRNKDNQLLMFQVAQWLRTTFKCLVILPMRDSTYDQYRDEPPLDTVVKDLVFRIDPPDLLKVIQARLDYITRITKQTDTTYVLQNGINVAIKQTELIEYFKCIMLAIRNNHMAANIFYRLSDRNTRNGIQLFEDFCKSGHVRSEDILRIRAIGNDALPNSLFLNALLRKNRKYYNGEHSNFVNLFASYPYDDFPDPFVRIDILTWLKKNNNKEGPSKDKGMFPVRALLKDLQLTGHRSEVVKREINYLLKRGLLVCESLQNEAVEDDLIKISIPGLLHLTLPSNVTYLAACAEDFFFKNTTIMTAISRRLESANYLSKASSVMTANDLITYLDKYRNEYFVNPRSFLADGTEPQLYDLEDCRNAIANLIERDSNVKAIFSAIQLYVQGTRVTAEVVKKDSRALVCLICDRDKNKGFISAYDPQKYGLTIEQYDQISEGDIIECEVSEYNYDHRSFQLRFLSMQPN